MICAQQLKQEGLQEGLQQGIKLNMSTFEQYDTREQAKQIYDAIPIRGI